MKVNSLFFGSCSDHCTEMQFFLVKIGESMTSHPSETPKVEEKAASTCSGWIMLNSHFFSTGYTLGPVYLVIIRNEISWIDLQALPRLAGIGKLENRHHAQAQ